MSEGRFVVGVTADRRGADQALMFRRRGFEVVHGPVMGTIHHADDTRLRELTETLIAEPPQYLVANTGLGMRSWLGLVDQWGLADSLRGALAHTRIAVRGPKAAAAVRSAGYPIWWKAPDERLASIIDRLRQERLDGASVYLQLHGDDHLDLTPRLEGAGAKVVELPVYRWTLPEESAGAKAIVEGCCEGEINAITFTAGPQARNLIQLARSMGLVDTLLSACRDRVLVGCVGPVCAKTAAEVGFDTSVVPEDWRLGALVKLVAETLEQKGRIGGFES